MVEDKQLFKVYMLPPRKMNEIIVVYGTEYCIYITACSQKDYDKYVQKYGDTRLKQAKGDLEFLKQFREKGY